LSIINQIIKIHCIFIYNWRRFINFNLYLNFNLIRFIIKDFEKFRKFNLQNKKKIYIFTIIVYIIKKMEGEMFKKIIFIYFLLVGIFIQNISAQERGFKQIDGEKGKGLYDDSWAIVINRH